MGMALGPLPIVAAALNASEDWRARFIAIQLDLPSLTHAVMAHLSNDAALAKQGFNPDQPHAPAGSAGSGEWTFAVPSYRAQVFPRQRDAWQRFHKAAQSLPGQSGTQSFAYGETFAGEGGMAPSAQQASSLESRGRHSPTRRTQQTETEIRCFLISRMCGRQED
jgi:hypothetical protein